MYMANNAELVDIKTCPPSARGTLSADAIQWMKDNGLWPEDPGTGDGGGSGEGSGGSNSNHVCEPDYGLKHPKKNFPFWI